jgi:hypothetical protein
VEHGEQFQPVVPDAVRNDVRGFGHHKFTGTEHSAWPPHLGLSLEEIDCFENSFCDNRRILLRVFCDALSQRDEVTYRPPGPNHFHRGAFVSPGLPQELSHFDTFSWLNSCPASNSAIPD